MKINGNLIFIYKTPEDAKIVFNSLEVDNDNYLKSKLKGNAIEYKIESDKLGSFLATADDLVASEIVVEKIVEKIKQ